MKKIAILIVALTFFPFCISKQSKVEKTVEDGVEVVINHLEPYKIKGEPAALILEEVLSIDTEKDEIAATGLTDIAYFDVDSEGNTYFLLPAKGQERLIFKFDRKGNFVTSFGRSGQGPGELGTPYHFVINNRDEILICEAYRRKLIIFDKDGKTFKEISKDLHMVTAIPLQNGNYIVRFPHGRDREDKYLSVSYDLYSSDFLEIKELDRFSKIPNIGLLENSKEKIINGIGWSLIGQASTTKIYIGNSERGYEILVFDLEGNLMRKIRKDYKPVDVSEDYKNKYMKPYVESQDELMKAWGEKIYFPKSWYPYHSFFTDEQGRLYIMTYEDGENPGEKIFDIFNPDGVFIARKSLNIYWHPGGALYGKVKANHLYCLREKENGFKELMVYKMKWE